TIRRLRRRVGSTATPLHSFFALVADCPSLRLVCDAQAEHVRAALAGTEHAHLPVLSAAAPFKAGGRGGPANYTDVPAGRLALRHVADLYAFPNALRAVRVTGAELAEWLERSAALFCRLIPGVADQPLIDPDFRSHNFDVIAGVTYAIDPTEPARYDAEGRLIDPAARRLRDLCHQGRPVAPDAEFVVATNSYRVALRQRDAGPGFRVILSPDVSNRDILLRHIAARSDVTPRAAPSWRLTVPPGTSALFDTSPRAVAHLAALPGLTLESAGDAPGGFARIRIRV
ncbi:MAG TPA: 5'-nucleotidase C-terminal domain-containing protein, partial [Paracoccaceae bacterium]|nr:5'-nucleotidase C-terminal domain-containing protein [Paracoccaceae bacterium]